MTLEEYFGDDKMECDCCGSRDVPLQLVPLTQGSQLYHEHRREDRPLVVAMCVMCCHTLTGRAWETGHVVSHDSLIIMQTICQVGNILWKELQQGA